MPSRFEMMALSLPVFDCAHSVLHHFVVLNQFLKSLIVRTGIEIIVCIKQTLKSPYQIQANVITMSIIP